jgi:hypothetical protein
MWLCQCDCGNKKLLSGHELKSGQMSCGCVNKPIDLTNRRFGRLIVKELSSRTKKTSFWLCKCDCGRDKVVSYNGLTTGTRSCGCLASQKFVQMNTTHGMSHHRLYGTYKGIKNRCEKPNFQSYPRYGGRGIKLHDPWSKEPKLFIEYLETNFKDLYSLLDQGYQIDRIDNDGNYEPGNITISSIEDQANNKSSNHLISAFGETLTVAKHLKKHGHPSINYGILLRRLKLGWESERALTTPRCTHGGPFMIDNVRFSQIVNLAQYFKISLRLVKLRLKKGWSLIESLTVPVGFERISLEKLKNIAPYTPEVNQTS